MSIIINQIRLKNWFNYQGDYEANTINFSDGMNIIIGDNNSGKTKLHNAIRWLLKDEVIIVEGNDATETKVEGGYLKKVINHSTFRNTEKGGQIIFGVQIIFTKYRRGEKQQYLLTKEFICRKDVNEAIFLRDNLKVQFIDSRTMKPRTITDEFSSIVKEIISENFIDFFLIEGEQLGSLTPLEGDRLQSTINSIVYLDVLDHMVSKSDCLLTKSDNLYDEVLNEEESLSSEIKNAVENIQIRKIEISEIESSIKEYENEKEINKKLIAEYKKIAENSAKKKKLVEEFEQLKHSVELEELKKENHIGNYISSLVSPLTFTISKIVDDNDVKDLLNSHKLALQSFASQRRTELNETLNEEEQRIIMSLEKSQPKPEILIEMVKEKHCYVCHKDLTEESIEFIENKLIPFFQNESEEDDVLDRLMGIHGFIKNIEVSSSRFLDEDLEYFKDIHDETIQFTDSIIEAQDNLKEFLEFNGKTVLEEGDDVNIETYTKAHDRFNALGKIIKDLLDDKLKIKGEVKKLEELVEKNKGSESEKLKQAKSLKVFSDNIYTLLRDYKRDTYKDFAQNLEKNATNRFHQFMKLNKAANHKIRAELIENSDGNFDFRIYVVDKFNEIQDQAGGADQALRRVSVIFALLDIAENKNGYPFIADAPASRLSPDNKKEFFISLLNDSALKQSIILTMDLISAKESKEQNKVVLSKIGSEVVSEVMKHEETSVITIHNDKFESYKS